jgi:hypothetical protein
MYLTSRMALGVVLAGGLTLLAGCAQTITPTDFIAKYTTNIDVPHPAQSPVSTRTFMGDRGGYYVITDEIPCAQGGGFCGTSHKWRCPVDAMPSDFPAAYKPGFAMIDGRRDATGTYMIQSYDQHKPGAATADQVNHWPAPAP